MTEVKTTDVTPTEAEEKTPKTEEKVSEIIDSSEIVGDYINFKDGEKTGPITVKQLRKVTGGDPRYNLANTEYKIEIDTIKGRILSVNAWTCFKELIRLRDSFPDKHLEGKTIQGFHEGKGKYRFEEVKA